MSNEPPASSLAPHRSLLIKICGLTDPAEARACAAAGADWVGLNFHPASPRLVDERRAAEIIAALPLSTRPVGLFVNRPPEEVAAVAKRVGLAIVQLHGDEPPEDLAALPDLQVVRAFRIGSDRDIAAMLTYLRRAHGLGRLPNAVLIDARVEDRYGGSGQTVDLGLLDLLRTLLPALPPVILAGGLTPENVAPRIARLRPWMVDVAGGVESAPGRKDPARVAALVQAARSV